MASKKGTPSHVKGYIMNKLFEKGCLGRGRSHGKHMTVRDLREGYDPTHHHLFEPAIRELKAEGLIHVFPARTGRGSEPHVVALVERLADARHLMNAFRKSVKLRPLAPDLREFAPRTA